jgi:hypothetical protein
MGDPRAGSGQARSAWQTVIGLDAWLEPPSWAQHRGAPG